VSKTEIKKQNRLETLDHLRGFFIIVIIIDHLSRWPSVFSLITGKALLWVTAAEGFVAISGLLVGYVRGYKNQSLPFRDVSVKLLRRALLLYVWSLIASIAYVAIIWNVHLTGGSPSTPMPAGDWRTFLVDLFTMQYTWVWVHFLTLYAIFLAASPIAIWFFRRGQAWIVAVISFALLALGWATKSEALQWQFLFFIPSIAGFYLHNIQSWWQRIGKQKQVLISTTTIGFTLLTIIISALFTFYAQSFQAAANYINTVLFAKDSISLWRASLAFVWFIGFMFAFYKLRAVISKYLNWLLIPIGTHSLTAYILHGVALCTISFFTTSSDNYIVNSLLGLTAVMITWGLLKIPLVRRVIPA